MYIVCSAWVLFLSSLRIGGLDSVTGQSSLICDLKDIYRIYRVNYAVELQLDEFNLYVQLNEPESHVNAYLQKCISDCENLKKTSLNDEEVKKRMTSYLNSAAEQFRVMADSGMSSDAFKSEYDRYQVSLEAYWKYIHTRFPAEKYTKISEKEYWKKIDKKNFRKARTYKDVEKYKFEDPDRSMKILKSLVNDTKDFQEQSIYKIELADFYVRLDGYLGQGIDGQTEALREYRSIIDSNIYTLYSYEAWLKWRAVSQRTHGLSTSSDIPNDE
ncbi:MAG: hypothetical protein KDC99_19305, partial [Cyclobacteriaceae bacterium]|nr:hypothetical protein [Cyclobacteriaceae bacterium]